MAKPVGKDDAGGPDGKCYQQGRDDMPGPGLERRTRRFSL